jgi:hypothetical protein
MALAARSDMVIVIRVMSVVTFVCFLLLFLERHDAHPQRAADGALDCTSWCARTSVLLPVVQRINHDMVRGIYDPCFTKKAAKNNWEGVETHLCHPCRD